jgi:hypothetical protein
MNSRETLFVHAVARFRSSLPLVTLQLWNTRHGYDLAQALARAAQVLLNDTIAFNVHTRLCSDGESEFFISINVDQQPFDLFGSNVEIRIEEAIFESTINLTQKQFKSFKLLTDFLEKENFFLSYWPADNGLQEAITEGILSASAELFPA